MAWADLFERASEYGTDIEAIRASLARQREGAEDA